MKFVTFFICLLCVMVSVAQADVKELAPDIEHISNQTVKQKKSFYCQAQEMGVQFLCDPDWEMEIIDDGAMLIVISDQPNVTLTVVKENSDSIVLSALTREVVQEIGQYRDDFVMKHVQIAGQYVVNVEAVARDDNDIRLSDYYITRDGTLFTFMFAVSPVKQFEQYIPTIFNIVNSIEFLD